MVIFMTIESFSTVQDWEKFNSSLLIEVTRTKGVFTCTGVALTPTLLVTAAHCLEGDVKKVRIFTGSSYNPKDPFFAVKNYLIHQSYNPKKSAYRNDIAKIELADSLPASIKIYPIFEGKEVKGDVLRFGFGARNKKNLRTVITPKFRRLNFAEEVVELDDTFSRSGDSGGPIYLENGTDIKVLAIHSTFSHGPQGRYSFNPMLSAYKDWIFPH
jgi:V8-like Glu-specific endopeptidase